MLNSKKFGHPPSVFLSLTSFQGPIMKNILLQSINKAKYWQNGNATNNGCGVPTEFGANGKLTPFVPIHHDIVSDQAPVLVEHILAVLVLATRFIAHN